MNVLEIFNLREKVGDVGIEIEFETLEPLSDAYPIPPGWTTHNEGSLRGYGYEIVLRQPCKQDKVNDYLSRAFELLAHNDVVPDSKNTSVHVHINCQQLTMVEVTSFATFYSILEPVLSKLWDEHREGNLFCLRCSDSGQQLEYITDLIFGKVPRPDRAKYSSINVAPLNEFGSLEFRAFHFPCTQEELERWIGILLQIRELAKNITPVEFLAKLSELGLQGLLEEYIPELLELYSDELVDEVYENMYPLQELIYNHMQPVMLDNVIDALYSGKSPFFIQIQGHDLDSKQFALLVAEYYGARANSDDALLQCRQMFVRDCKRNQAARDAVRVGDDLL